jgi:hypothetical protein
MAWIALSLMYRGYKLHFAQDWLDGNERLAEAAASTDKDDHNPANSPRISKDQETL